MAIQWGFSAASLRDVPRSDSHERLPRSKTTAPRPRREAHPPVNDRGRIHGIDHASPLSDNHDRAPAWRASWPPASRPRAGSSARSRTSAGTTSRRSWTRSWRRSACASRRTPASRSRSTTSRPPQQAAKYASEVQTQAGHDLVEMRMHFPWLYERQLVDVSGHRGDLEKKYGKVLSSAATRPRTSSGVWRAVPQYHAMFVATYREDLFKKAGLKIPDTWEDLYTRRQGAEEDGAPGRDSHQPELRHDLDRRAGPLVVRRASRSTRTARPSRSTRPQTAQMIEWYRKMFRDCMEPRCLSWDDASNNQSIQQGKAGWIHNPVSAYIVASDDEAPDRGRHQPPPDARAGPAGRHETAPCRARSASGSSRRTSSRPRSSSAISSAERRAYDEYIMSARRLPSCRSTRSCRTIRCSRPIRSYAALRARGREVSHCYGWPAPADATRCSSSPIPSSCPT